MASDDDFLGGPGGGRDLFRGLLEAAPDAMVIADDTGIIQLVNAQTEAVFGYPRDELLGQPVEMLVPHRFRGHHPIHRHGYSANQTVRPMGAGLDLFGRCKDGREFPVEISLSPLETPDGLLISAAVRDVSDRRVAEERISELAELVESSQDAIVTKTLDGTITFWNAAAQRLYGYDTEHVIGRHVAMLSPPDRKEEITDLLERIGRGERVEHYETQRVASDGRLLDVDVTVWPTRSKDGTIIGAGSIARDVADRKRAEKELTDLYQQQRHVALTLQRSLMGIPEEIPDTRTASRYLPSTRGEGVGGDWFDLIALGGGKVGVIIGDVMGRGLDAAVVMGQLRSAARALALAGLHPSALMQALDDFTCGLPGQLVTCAYLEVDPVRGEATGCSAGHLPLYLIAADATVSELPVPVSVPLGVGGIAHEQACFPIHPDATLALYTDGLVETPSSDLELQLDLLTTSLHRAFSATACLEEIADRVVRALLPDTATYADDVTLLLVSFPAAPLGNVAQELPCERVSVPTARRFVRHILRSWDLAALEDTALLLVSETVTNAICHARGPLRLHLRHSAREVAVEITDHSSNLPLLRLADTDDENGRGLLLVQSLAHTWGTRPTADGKTVWFTLLTAPPGATGVPPFLIDLSPSTVAD